eukprot:g64809.t1
MGHVKQTDTGRLFIARALAPIFLGDMFEWYEWTIYGFFEPVISRVLVQNNSAAAWAIQWVTFLARPVGGLMLGWIGDKYGRKRALLASLLGVVVFVFLQGCLPTFCDVVPGSEVGQSAHTLTRYCGQRAGRFGVVMLVLLRILQGLFVGGEIGSAMTVLFEAVDTRYIGFSGCMLFVCNTIGFLLASAIASLIFATVTDLELVTWGWRIPFLIVIFPGLYLVWKRVQLNSVSLTCVDEQHSLLPDEVARAASDVHLADFQNHTSAPPETTAHKRPSNTKGQSLWESVINCFLGILMVMAFAVAVMAFAVAVYVNTGGFLAAHMQEKKAVGTSQGPAIMSIMDLLTILLIFPLAWIVDTWGAHKVMCLAGLFALVSSFPMWILIEIAPSATRWGSWQVWLSALLGMLQNVLYGGCTYTVVPELFALAVRNTGCAITYNIAFMIGGLGPVMVSAATHITSERAAGTIGTVFAAISLGASLLTRCLNSRGYTRAVHRRAQPW